MILKPHKILLGGFMLEFLIKHKVHGKTKATQLNKLIASFREN